MEKRMLDANFDAVKSKLDIEIDAIAADSSLHIMLGSALYAEFRHRGLLKPKLCDMVFWKWNLPSYREKFVADGFDIEEFDFKVGTKDANRT
jgi:hypothetical protein